MHNTISRARWAAFGAALAVALGAGGIGIAHAALGSGERTAFVPISPCRLADSRPGDDHIGDIAGALVEDASATLEAHGVHGNCVLPMDATGLALNVTAVNQTRLTYLTLWPADRERPKTSNLNPAPGQPPTPNAVTVDLDAAGRFSVYNRFGTVDIVVDVVGYYADHHHDDRYYTRTEADTALAVKANSSNVYTKAEVDAAIDAAIAAAAPLAFDRTIGVGQTAELFQVSGVSVSASCDSPTAASLYVDANVGSFWLYGASPGPADFEVNVAAVDHWETVGAADFLYFNGVLYSGGDYYQLAIYSGHFGEPCTFWGVVTRAYR
jgi:hypothetical protein